jgi:hypothetical protein
MPPIGFMHRNRRVQVMRKIGNQGVGIEATLEPCKLQRLAGCSLADGSPTQKKVQNCTLHLSRSDLEP